MANVAKVLQAPSVHRGCGNIFLPPRFRGVDTLSTGHGFQLESRAEIKVLEPQSRSKEEQRRADLVKDPANAAKDSRPMNSIFFRSDEYLVISYQDRARVVPYI